MSKQEEIKYSYTGGVVPLDSPYYIEREADKDLLRELKSGQFCYVFNSRQIGKSSLLVRTKRALESKKFICVDLDCAGDVGKEFDSFKLWCNDFIELIAAQLEIDLEPWQNRHGSLPNLKRLGSFFEYLLYTYQKSNIIIFLDEVDSLLTLKFGIDDFFAFIRRCYNRRSSEQNFRRLTFVLFGVATPSELIQDERTTPFNIGKKIELRGFSLDESLPLAEGLIERVANPQEVLKTILAWTGGQPFLTQKICNLVLESSEYISDDCTTEIVDRIIRTQIVEDWVSKDDPQHLGTIRDLLLRKDRQINRVLKLYKRILNGELISVDKSLEQAELRLSGLVIERQGKLEVFNRIYGEVFDQKWVNQAIADSEVHPFRPLLQAWLNSNQKDESRLLQGKALQEALEWAKNRKLSDEEKKFLEASQEASQKLNQKLQDLQAESEKAEQLEQALQKKAEEAERVSEQVAKTQQKLEEAKQKIAKIEKWRLGFLIAIGALSVLTSLGFALKHFFHLKAANDFSSKIKSEPSKLESLVFATRAGQELEAIVRGDQTFKDYPTVAPLLALQQSLDNIFEKQQFKYSSNQNRFKSVGITPYFWDRASFSLAWSVAIADLNGKVWLNRGQQSFPWQAHTQPIESISFNSDGRLLATVGKDGKVKIWDVVKVPSRASADPKLLTELPFKTGWGKSISFSSSDQYLAIGSDGGHVHLWRRKQDDWNQNIQYHKWIAHPLSETKVEAVAFNPKHNLLATGGGDGQILLWDLSNSYEESLKTGQAKVKLQLSPPKRVESLSFSQSGTLLAAALGDGSIKLWHLSKPNNEWVAEEQLTDRIRHPDKGPINRVVFNSNSHQLTTVGSNGEVHVWILIGKENNFTDVVNVPLKGHQGNVWDASSNNKQLATAGEDSVRIWDLSELQSSSSNITRKPISQIIVSPKGKAIVEVSKDGTAHFWSDFWNEPWNNSENQPIQLNSQCKEKKISSVRFSWSEQRIAIVGNSGSVCIVDYSGENITPRQSGSALRAVEFGAHGQVFTVDKDSKLVLWTDLWRERKKEIETNVKQIIFNSNTQYLAVLLKDDRFTLLDRNTHPVSDPEISGYFGGVANASFSKDGRWIGLAGNNGKVGLWSLYGEQPKMQRTPVMEFQHKGKAFIIFSPDGEHFLTAGENDSLIRLHLLNTNQSSSFNQQSKPREWSIESDKDLWDIKFSSDGQLVAASLDDGTIKLWDLKEREIFKFQSFPRSDFEFSPDSEWIVYVRGKEKDIRLEVEPISLNGLLKKSCAWLNDSMNQLGEEETRELKSIKKNCVPD